MSINPTFKIPIPSNHDKNAMYLYIISIIYQKIKGNKYALSDLYQ